jgi:hypothetical protein
MKTNTSECFAVKFRMQHPVSSTFPFAPDHTLIEVKRFESAADGRKWFLEKIEAYNAGDGAKDPFREFPLSPASSPEVMQVFEDVLSEMWDCNKILHVFSTTSKNYVFCVCSLKEGQ